VTRHHDKNVVKLVFHSFSLLFSSVLKVPPDKPVNVRCETSRSSDFITCTWERGRETHLLPTYNVSLYRCRVHYSSNEAIANSNSYLFCYIIRENGTRMLIDRIQGAENVSIRRAEIDENTTHRVVITAYNHFAASRSDPFMLRVKDISELSFLSNIFTFKKECASPFKIFVHLKHFKRETSHPANSCLYFITSVANVFELSSHYQSVYSYFTLVCFLLLRSVGFSVMPEIPRIVQIEFGNNFSAALLHWETAGSSESLRSSEGLRSSEILGSSESLRSSEGLQSSESLRSDVRLRNLESLRSSEGLRSDVRLRSSESLRSNIRLQSSEGLRSSESLRSDVRLRADKRSWVKWRLRCLRGRFSVCVLFRSSRVTFFPPPCFLSRKRERQPNSPRVWFECPGWSLWLTTSSRWGRVAAKGRPAARGARRSGGGVLEKVFELTILSFRATGRDRVRICRQIQQFKTTTCGWTLSPGPSQQMDVWRAFGGPGTAGLRMVMVLWKVTCHWYHECIDHKDGYQLNIFMVKKKSQNGHTLFYNAI